MMTQKSNEEIYKSLSEEERNVTVTSVELTDKAFKGKTDYSAIARLNGKVVFREGEYFSTLEGLQLFVFKNGKQITAYNWKIEDTCLLIMQSRIISKTQIWETKSGLSGMPLLQRRCIMRESSFNATTSSLRFLMWTARSTRL